MSDPAFAAMKSHIDHLLHPEKVSIRRETLDFAIRCAPVLNMHSLDEIFAAAGEIEGFINGSRLGVRQSDAA